MLHWVTAVLRWAVAVQRLAAVDLHWAVAVQHLAAVDLRWAVAV